MKCSIAAGCAVYRESFNVFFVSLASFWCLCAASVPPLGLFGLPWASFWLSREVPYPFPPNGAQVRNLCTESPSCLARIPVRPVENIQNKFNQLQRAYAHQCEYPESESEDIDIEISEEVPRTASFLVKKYAFQSFLGSSPSTTSYLTRSWELPGSFHNNNAFFLAGLDFAIITITIAWPGD